MSKLPAQESNKEQQEKPWFCYECEGDGRCIACGGDGEYWDDWDGRIYTCVECDGTGNCPNCTAHYAKEDKEG